MLTLTWVLSRAKGSGRTHSFSTRTLMISRTTAFEEAGAVGRTPDRDASGDRSGSGSLLVVAAWCGLVSGLLEVGATVLRKQTVEVNQFYWTSRHFVWLVPLIDLAIFLGLGMVLSVTAWLSRRRLEGCSARVVGGLALLPPLLAAFPGIYGLAGTIPDPGDRGAAAPLSAAPCRRSMVGPGHPSAHGRICDHRGGDPLGPGLGGGLARGARPRPSPGSPNVLLIVLDTVAADHLSLHGYHRLTSPTLGELARTRRLLQRGAGDLILDATISWEHVHGTMAPRAFGWLADSARPNSSDRGRVPALAGLHHRRLRGQLAVLWLGLRAGAGSPRIGITAIPGSPP